MAEAYLSKNLLSTKDLSAPTILKIFEIAKKFQSAVSDQKIPSLLNGQTIANLFFENSTRTRLSFELATRDLGGKSLNFQSRGSSTAKGETFYDTAKTVESMRPQCLVVRHSSAGSAFVLSNILDIPVINAGDGFHEHPTQGLLDVYTMQEKLGSLKGKRVVIIGDIAHSRVARSNIYVLNTLGASVAVCGPPTLLPPHPETMNVDFAYRPEELLKDADVVMSLRIQLERQNNMQIPSLSEYSRFWGINKDRANLLKENAIILHPGPVNRGIEIEPEVADSPRSKILNQVSNGIIIRMAVLALLCAPEKLLTWLGESK